LFHGHKENLLKWPEHFHLVRRDGRRILQRIIHSINIYSFRDNYLLSFCRPCDLYLYDSRKQSDVAYSTSSYARDRRLLMNPRQKRVTSRFASTTIEVVSSHTFRPHLTHFSFRRYRLSSHCLTLCDMEPSSTTASIESPSALSKLPQEILFAIFKLLDRPSKLSLGLTSPYFLHSFANYYDLDRYRDKTDKIAQRKFGLPEGISWADSMAQPTIIRWLALPGCDDIDDPPPIEEEEYPIAEEEVDSDIHMFRGPLDIYEEDEEYDLPTPYEESELGQEDAIVEAIISDWLRTKLHVHGGVVLCGECQRYMRILRPDGKIDPWSENMLNRPRYVG
jgi:hypothetical protein